MRLLLDTHALVWWLTDSPQPLAVTMRHAQRAGGLASPHKDPFDRMLIAQALEEACTLISNEAVFDRYAVSRVW